MKTTEELIRMYMYMFVFQLWHFRNLLKNYKLMLQGKELDATLAYLKHAYLSSAQSFSGSMDFAALQTAFEHRALRSVLQFVIFISTVQITSNNT